MMSRRAHAWCVLAVTAVDILVAECDISPRARCSRLTPYCVCLHHHPPAPAHIQRRGSINVLLRHDMICRQGSKNSRIDDLIRVADQKTILYSVSRVKITIACATLMSSFLSIDAGFEKLRPEKIASFCAAQYPASVNFLINGAAAENDFLLSKKAPASLDQEAVLFISLMSAAQFAPPPAHGVFLFGWVRGHA